MDKLSIAEDVADNDTNGAVTLPPLETDDRKIVRKIERNPWNRLRSIKEDAVWVREVSDSLGGAAIPVVPNLRCGAWYITPDVARRSQDTTFCYFKSTDGHADQWSFSLKRPNLDAARLLQRHGRVIITDSTRRGKSLPDALSKTIPAWCAVMTEASRKRYGGPSSSSKCSHGPFRETQHTGESLYTPTHQVPTSEHSQMQQRIEGWVASLLASDLPIPRLDKSILPFFLTRPSDKRQERELLQSLREHSFPDDVYVVVLLGASKRVDLPCLSSDQTYYYTQGSGDDEEIWSGGLTPGMFWDEKNHSRMMSCSQEDLPGVIEQVVQEARAAGKQTIPSHGASESGQVQLAESIFCIDRRSLSHQFSEGERAKWTLLIHCDGQRVETKEEDCPSSNSLESSPLYLNIPHGKAGGAHFRKSIPTVVDAVQRALNSDPQATVLVCDSTKDRSLAIGMCTALLAVFYTSKGTAGLTLTSETRRAHCDELTKDDVRRRLQWISADVPGANPSRALMLRINEVLLSSVYKRG